MRPKKFKLALIQMQVKGGELYWNLNHAIQQIKKAAANGADFALLPECMDLGWTHPSSATLAEPIPQGSPCQTLMSEAKKHGIYICAGLTEKSEDRVYNAAVIIDRNGQLLIKHRKLNELDIGHAFYAQGDRLNVAETEFGTIGLMICADGSVKDQVIARALGYMGCDVILSPCAWAVPEDHDNDASPYGELWRNAYSPVAKDFSIPIFGVSNVGKISGGPWENWKCIGCSLAIDSRGNEILQAPYGIDAETTIYIDAYPQPRPARGTDWQRIWLQQ